MVEYLDGGRIQGSSTLTSTNHTSWKEIDRVTLSSSGDTLDTSAFTAKDNIMFLFHILRPSSGDQNIRIRFNGDSGSNYSERYSLNGGSDTTATSQANIALHSGVVNENFGYFELKNIASKEKLCIGHVTGSNADGAGNAPSRREQTFKWANTSDQVTRIEIVNTSTGDFEAGSELVVLGCDDDEADSGTPFWQEIKDVTLSSSSDTLDSGTMTAKKYLFVTWKTSPTGGNTDDIKVRFNNDSGSNYTYRRDAGSTDETFTSTNNPRIDAGNGAYERDGFMYIVNKSDREKLLYAQDVVSQGTGGGQAPRYFETAMKWANTSDQINRIELINQGSGDIASSSHMRIFGAD